MFNLMIPTKLRSNGHMPSLLNDGYFTDFLGPESAFREVAKMAAWPAVDIHELKDKFVLRADIPGVKENDIRIEFTDGALVIEGTRRSEEEKQEYLVRVQERAHRQFKRTFVLGDGVEADKIQAAYSNGTLTVEIPKAERAIPRSIPIAVNNKH